MLLPLSITPPSPSLLPLLPVDAFSSLLDILRRHAHARYAIASDISSPAADDYAFITLRRHAVFAALFSPLFRFSLSYMPPYYATCLYCRHRHAAADSFRARVETRHRLRLCFFMR